VSLLTIVTEVCGRLALSQPTSVVGSTDTQVQQLFALANKAGHDLAQAHPWQDLMEEATFTTVASPVQSAAIPLDLDRMVPDSIYNRTTRRPVGGPITPQEWQARQAQPAISTVVLVFRQRQGQFLISPTPPADQTIAYEYVSKNWAKGALGAAQAQFLADTDTAYLDESLIADAVVWMFLRSKGFSYAEEMKTYERNLEQQAGRDGGSGALTLTPEPVRLDRVNLPDGDFPGA
jgi:hypothetical protein